MSKIELNTKIFGNGKIEQELKQIYNNHCTNITRNILDTSEKHIQEALIKLGWTPPEGKEHINFKIKILEFIYNRMLYQHKESRDIDYMIHFKKNIDELKGESK